MVFKVVPEVRETVTSLDEKHRYSGFSGTFIINKTSEVRWTVTSCYETTVYRFSRRPLCRQ